MAPPAPAPPPVQQAPASGPVDISTVLRYVIPSSRMSFLISFIRDHLSNSTQAAQPDSEVLGGIFGDDEEEVPDISTPTQTQPTPTNLSDGGTTAPVSTETTNAPPAPPQPEKSAPAAEKTEEKVEIISNLHSILANPFKFRLQKDRARKSLYMISSWDRLKNTC